MESSPPGYSRRLLKSIAELWNNSFFCDVTLVIGNEKIDAHKNILAAASPFFKAMFLSGMEEGNKKEVNMQEISADIFRIIMTFLYTGVVTVNVDTCQDLISAADMLGIEDVVDICSHFLISNLEPSNCVGIFAFADAHTILHLKRQAQLFLEKNFVDAVAADEFVHLEFKALLSILSSEKLHIESEVQVLEAGLRWVLGDLPRRRRHLLQVLNEVRLNLVTPRQLEHIRAACDDQGVKVLLTKISKDFHSLISLTSLNFYLPVDIPNLKTCPRENAKRYIYLAGGYSRRKTGFGDQIRTLDRIERYDVYTEQWQSYEGMTQPRSSHGIAILDRKVVVAGGEDAFLITASVESFDPDENVWTQLPSMKHPRYGLGLVSHGDYLYAIGGYVGSEIGTTVERFDPSCELWEEVDSMPNPRFSMAVVEYEGLIYISGGLSELSMESDALESYNPVTKEWCPLARLKCPRAYHGLVAYEGSLYAIGGFNEYHGSLCSVEKYSIKDNVWSTVSPMQASRAGAGVAVLGTCLYVFGGRCQDVMELPGAGGICPSLTLDSAEVYDFGSDQWTSLPHMSGERCEAVALVL